MTRRPDALDSFSRPRWARLALTVMVILLASAGALLAQADGIVGFRVIGHGPSLRALSTRGVMRISSSSAASSSSCHGSRDALGSTKVRSIRFCLRRTASSASG